MAIVRDLSDELDAGTFSQCISRSDIGAST